MPVSDHLTGRRPRVWWVWVNPAQRAEAQSSEVAEAISDFQIFSLTSACKRGILAVSVNHNLERPMTREEWLVAATDLLRPDFIHIELPIPETVDVLVIMQLTPAPNSLGALMILIQDLLNLCTPLWEDRHKYADARIDLGLEGYKVSTIPTPELTLRLQSIITELGDYPAPAPELLCPACGCSLAKELS
jgi:hypothetical protein